MARIDDPDQLNQGTEVVIDTANKYILLSVAGNLDNNSPGATSGVTMQALYSFLKEEWRTDTALNKFKFPLKALTKFKFDFQNSWVVPMGITAMVSLSFFSFEPPQPEARMISKIRTIEKFNNFCMNAPDMLN